MIVSTNTVVSTILPKEDNGVDTKSKSSELRLKVNVFPFTSGRFLIVSISSFASSGVCV